MNNGKDPIYPRPHQNSDGTIQHDVYIGLTKREYFAGLAMQGLLANPTGYSDREWQSHVIKDSVAMADKLLKALEEQYAIHRTNRQKRQRDL